MEPLDSAKARCPCPLQTGQKHADCIQKSLVASLGAFFRKILHNGGVLQSFRRIERRSAIRVGNVEINAELGRQLDRFKAESFGFATGRPDPRRSSAHSERGHSGGGPLAPWLKSFSRDGIGNVHDLRISAVLDQQPHGSGLAEASGQPEGCRSHQRWREVEVTR